MKNFREALAQKGRVFFDGGIGTMLQAAGLPAGMSPEAFGMERPEVMGAIHKAYVDAGADVITTNTFGASRCKLPKGTDVVAFNRTLAGYARDAVEGTSSFVVGSVGPTGVFLRPLGPMTFKELIEIFREQIRGLVQGGVHLILAETQFDLAEARAIVIAARQECSLPVGVSMTFESGMSLTGTSPEVFCETMLNMGVDFLGTNCSAGPEQMLDIATRIRNISTVPVIAQPNAGLPELENGRTVFRLGAPAFAEHMVKFARSGISLLGGCCGTTPAHVAAVRAAVQDIPVQKPLQDTAGKIVLTSRSMAVPIGAGLPIQILGERINPTGKKKLTAELQAGQFGLALSFAEEQITAGAKILDVNVGAPMVDETVLLPALVERLVAAHPVVLCLDSANPDALAEALNVYPASALVNSINGDEGRMEKLGPLCRDYGAPFILLPLKGRKLPVAARERIAIIEELLQKALALGIPRRLIMVDVLALAVSSKPEAGKACLETIRYCTETLGLPTTIGLSNISFGLPARELLNSAFLAMAAGAGLSSCIGNPGVARMAQVLASSNALLGHDINAECFISQYSAWKSGVDSTSGIANGAIASSHVASTQGQPGLTLEEAIIKGKCDQVEDLVKAELEAGAAPFALVRDRMIPAITEVGRKYEKKEYFLPQLLRSAETMQKAFATVKPLLEQDTESQSRPVMVLATVEGDIHDIGKNIVALMLSNHGFEVVDLGKDVKAEAIVDAAMQNNASLIGLSALMTTTMVKMEDTVRLLSDKNLKIPVMVGGAVVTKAFAESIGAHYSSDAVDCVRVAKELLENV